MTHRATAAAEVARLIAPILGLTEQDQADQVAAYHAALDEERRSAHLPETALDASLGA